MKNFLAFLTIVALVGCGGGGGSSTSSGSAFAKSYTGTSEWYYGGELDPELRGVEVDGTISKSGAVTFYADVEGAAGQSGIPKDKITGTVDASGNVANATLSYVDSDGIKVQHGTGTVSTAGGYTSATFAFKTNDTVPEDSFRFVMTLD